MVLVVGGGPVGAHVGRSLSQCGIGNVTLKVLPRVGSEVRDLMAMAGVRCIDEWTDLQVLPSLQISISRLNE